MKTYLDCYPCFLRQALSAARHAHASVELQRHVLLETMAQLRVLPAQATPPEMAELIHRMVRQETATPDPYAQSKRDATAQALTLLPALREHLRLAADPLQTAVRVAIAGNIIDNGSAAPGTLLEHCSAAFRDQFAKAPLIIAKGQANYETLSETQAPVFFLLQAKCSVIADDLGVPVASVVLKPPKAMGRQDGDDRLGDRRIPARRSRLRRMADHNLFGLARAHRRLRNTMFCNAQTSRSERVSAGDSRTRDVRHPLATTTRGRCMARWHHPGIVPSGISA